MFVGCSAFSDKIGGNIKGRVQGQREVTACDVVYNLANEKRGRLVDFLLTSIPACRKTLRAERNDRYFDFKHLKICAHPNISNNFL